MTDEATETESSHCKCASLKTVTSLFSHQSNCSTYGG